MDLSELKFTEASDEGADMEVRNPKTDEVWLRDGKPVTIRLAGIDSTRYRQAIAEAGDRRLSKRGDPKYLQLQSSFTEVLAKCTISWNGIVKDGKPWECTKEHAMKLYQSEAWLRQQVEDFINDRANFFSKSEKH